MLSPGMLAVDSKGQLAFLAPRPAFAAHSMDTDWYAVDRQGHVARWQSGEEGAVPYDALACPWDELFAELAMHQARVLLDEDDGEGGGLGSRPALVSIERAPRRIGVHELHDAWSGVIQFESAEYFQMFQSECAHWVDRSLAAPHSLAVRDLLTVVFQDYWSAGAVRVACVIPPHVSPHDLGLYEYSCDFSGPYRRVYVPKRRLLVQELPEPLRAKLSALQLSLDFGSAERFDPESKVKCRLYGRT